jgi:hypothetical protein
VTVAAGGIACIVGAVVCSFNFPALTLQGRQLILANFMPAGIHK